MAVCKRKIGAAATICRADGKFYWQEVECLGACVNAPMAAINDHYYEDLTPESFEKLMDDFAAGKTPKPGSAIGRQGSAPEGGRPTLTDAKLFDGSLGQEDQDSQPADRRRSRDDPRCAAPEARAAPIMMRRSTSLAAAASRAAGIAAYAEISTCRGRFGRRSVARPAWSAFGAQIWFIAGVRRREGRRELAGMLADKDRIFPTSTASRTGAWRARRRAARGTARPTSSPDAASGSATRSRPRACAAAAGRASPPA